MAIVHGTTNSDLLNAADGITSDDDDVYGGDGNDTIRGLGGDDKLFGEDGRDKLYGGIGSDWLEGGKNNDDLFGGDDNDFLWGDEGDDELYGENDSDFLEGGAGADRLDGGDGIDWAAYYGSEEGVHVSLSPFLIGGNWGGDAEGDILVNIEYLAGSRYGDEFYGNDQANLVYGMEGNDVLVGDGGDDQLEGGAGNDVLDGGDGADYMRGGTGNDHYFVNHADDVVIEYADEGLDTDTARIDGDHVEYPEGEGIDTVNARTDYTLGDHVENLVLLAGGGVNGTGNDGDNGIAGNELSNLLNGGGGADTLKGAGGDDFLDGGTGADLMLGGEGGDIFIVDDAGDVVTEHADEGFDMVQTGVSYSLAAGSEVEVLYADPATTTAAINLTGNEFDNFLTGNEGINVLVGGLGIDILRGNGGGDAFLWSSVAETGLSNWDIITDFNTAEDVLHFTNIDADETLADDQNFTFRGVEAFTAAGQINWFGNGTDTFIQLNTDADLDADGIIQLNGVLSGDAVLMFL
jgi:Ca2+-binding RTX toxin-like protein